jgi:hypothetical protein
VFDEEKVDNALEKMIDIDDILHLLHKIFERTANKCPQLIQVIPTVDLTLNWLLNIYDV